MLLQKVLRIARNTKALHRSVALRSIQLSQKGNRHYISSSKLLIATPFMAMGIWSLSDKEAENEAIVTRKEVLLAKADALFDQGQFHQIYKLLSNYRDSQDVEILWRICRSLYHMSLTASEVEAKKMAYEGYDLISTALSIKEDNSAVHKWMCIFLDAKCRYQGIKARIKELYNIKKHMLRAAELNPTDATTLFMLGSWCYQVSDLPWYQRKIAQVAFGEIPLSSFQDALVYFETAEKIDPNFYSQNLLMLGKTYLKLNRKEEALTYLKRAVEFPAKNDEDHEAKKEAQNLLNSIQ